jgi:hypothetical protein
MTPPHDILGRPIVPGAPVVFARTAFSRGLGRGLVLAVEPCGAGRGCCRGHHVWIRAMLPGWRCQALSPRTLRIGAADRVVVVPGALSPEETAVLGKHRFRRGRPHVTRWEAEQWMRAQLEGLGTAGEEP